MSMASTTPSGTRPVTRSCSAFVPVCPYSSSREAWHAGEPVVDWARVLHPRHAAGTMRRLVLSVLSVLACSASDVPEAGESTGDVESTGDAPPTTTTAPTTDAESSTTEPEIPADAPTFYGDILPVIAAQCQS